MLEQVLDEIRVPRVNGGRPRTRPDSVAAGKAYTSGVNRRMLSARGVKAVIPEKSDQIAARKRKGRNGGRPPSIDTAAYRDRNVVERSFARIKQWRGLATRYDKLAITYRAGAVLNAIITWTNELGGTAKRRIGPANRLGCRPSPSEPETAWPVDAARVVVGTG